MITKKRKGPLLTLSYLHAACGLQEVGTLSGYYMMPDYERPTHYFQITNVFVAEGWRNKGIGTALLQRMLSDLVKNKIPVVTLDDFSDTGRCYLKFGFTYIVKGSPEMELFIGTPESPPSKTCARPLTHTSEKDKGTAPVASAPHPAAI